MDEDEGKAVVAAASVVAVASPNPAAATTVSDPEEIRGEPQRQVRQLPPAETLDRDHFSSLWEEQNRYVDYLEAKLKKSSQVDLNRREHLLVVRLAAKEQETQELANQIAELKAAQAPSTAAMRNALLDPAVNLVVQKLRKELEAKRSKLQETQEELSAWKFTPDSVTGKKLMAKCRQLLQENEDIGKMISSGRLAKLEGELCMQRELCEEMKKNQLEMDDLVQELDEDMEGMQSTIYFLQQQLKEAKERIAGLEDQLSHANANGRQHPDNHHPVVGVPVIKSSSGEDCEAVGEVTAGVESPQPTDLAEPLEVDAEAATVAEDDHDEDDEDDCDGAELLEIKPETFDDPEPQPAKEDEQKGDEPQAGETTAMTTRRGGRKRGRSPSTATTRSETAPEDSSSPSPAKRPAAATATFSRSTRGRRRGMGGGPGAQDHRASDSSDAVEDRPSAASSRPRRRRGAAASEKEPAGAAQADDDPDNEADGGVVVAPGKQRRKGEAAAAASEDT